MPFILFTDELDYILKEDIYYIIRQISFDAKTGELYRTNNIKISTFL